MARQHASKSISETAIRNMDMTDAFVLKESTRSVQFYVTSCYKTDDKFANIKIESVTGNMRKIHGTCQVILVEEIPTAWIASEAQILFLLKSRIEAL